MLSPCVPQALQSELAGLRVAPPTRESGRRRSSDGDDHTADAGTLAETVNARDYFRMHLLRVSECLHALVNTSTVTDPKSKALLASVKSVADNAAVAAASNVAGTLLSLFLFLL